MIIFFEEKFRQFWKVFVSWIYLCTLIEFFPQKIGIKYTVIKSKIEVGISSNLLHSISTSICIRKCNKNFSWFRSHFLEKSMGYSTVIFSDFGSFLKMNVTRKIEVGISSNLLHSISTSICIRKCNKKFSWFRSHFLEKSMGYSTVIFLDFGPFLKRAVTRKIEVGISSNLLQSISTSICIRKCNKFFCDFGAIFWKNPWAIVQWFF